jgi:cytochrome c peroxidase
MGRARETGSTADMYAFRTPPLRNVAVNGPWFHDGAYTTLEAAVRHMLDPAPALSAYDPSQLPESMRLVYDDPERIATVLDYLDARLTPRTLDDGDVADLIAFLEALTDPRVDEIATRVPDRVPSGLPVDR